jgi:hypothetical protein
MLQEHFAIEKPEMSPEVLQHSAKHIGINRTWLGGVVTRVKMMKHHAVGHEQSLWDPLYQCGIGSGVLLRLMLWETTPTQRWVLFVG